MESSVTSRISWNLLIWASFWGILATAPPCTCRYLVTGTWGVLGAPLPTQQIEKKAVFTTHLANNNAKPMSPKNMKLGESLGQNKTPGVLYLYVKNFPVSFVSTWWATCLSHKQRSRSWETLCKLLNTKKGGGSLSKILLCNQIFF